MEDADIKEQLLELQKQQQEIILKLEAKAVRKDGWDKLQCMAPILSGFLIGGFGAFIGYSYNQQQIKLQEAETIERFIPHLAGNEKTKKAAILAMSSLTNTELAAKMASLFASEGTVSALESIARSGDVRERNLATEAMARAFNNMAQRSQDENNPDQAEAYLRKAIQLKEKVSGANSNELCESLDRLADLYAAQGKLDKAEPLLRRSLALKEKRPDGGSASTTDSIRRLAQIMDKKGETSDPALTDPPAKPLLKVDEHGEPKQAEEQPADSTKGAQANTGKAPDEEPAAASFNEPNNSH